MKTIKSYLYGLRECFIFEKNKFDKLDTENIKNFLLFSERKGISAQTRNLLLNANEIEKILQATENTKHKLLPALSYGAGLRVLENGVDVRYVQELLGHRNIRTTQRYTQVTNPKSKNIKSPL